uniref:uncharacterized protein LOC101308274 isoform X1 n=1 Tax=Fragaria vesca subsp. vesca TaxID=101020 RepID=UPI0005C8BCA7|nr:PREDICTED: uncharacterized protein LOC101308274 isoform X1 [Fragaria vesca subsp. vesca]
MSNVDEDEVRLAALAYYSNLSEELKEMAKTTFDKMDSDRNGRISLEEYRKHLANPGESTQMKSSSFNVVDKNGDGKLDYWEFITLYYLDKSGRLNCWCNGHGCKNGTFLSGLYFTCVTCFSSSTEPELFYLCWSCYRNRRYTHKHDNFLDNYTFLQMKIAPCIPAATPKSQVSGQTSTSNTESQSSNETPSSSNNPKKKARSGTQTLANYSKALNIINVLAEIAKAAVNVGGCSIM